MGTGIEQDVQVYRQGDTFITRGAVDGTVLCSGPSAATVLQSAVDTARVQGGKVTLSRGVYPLEKPLYLVDNVMLQGSGRGTQLKASGQSGILCQSCKGVTIGDLEIMGEPGADSTAGVILADCGDCQVRDVFVHGFVGYGIWVRNNSFLCELRSCKVADNGMANIYLENLAQGGRGGDFVPNLISGCITYGGKIGIECSNVIVLNILGCVVFQPAQYAYYLHHTSNSILISGCRSFQVESHAVVVESTHELNITGNIFCWHRGHGLVLSDVSWGTVTGNEFIDQGVRARDGVATNGVVLERHTQGVQVVGNTVFNWGDQCPMRSGIEEDQTCRNNTIAHNNINYFVEQAVHASGIGTLVTDNVVQKEPAYQGAGRPPYPDFTTDRLKYFMDETL
jgi:hypothetical protein